MRFRAPRLPPEGGYGAQSVVALPFRTIRAVLLVPIVEELFWRAWLMRYLIDHAFETWRRITFELRAFLFVAGHGRTGTSAFWLDCFTTGGWMVRT